VDGDGLNEVVVLTREGYLWVWDTTAPVATEEWPKKRHDLRNTGNYEEAQGLVSNPPQATPTPTPGGGPTHTATPTVAATPTVGPTGCPLVPRAGCKRPVTANKSQLQLRDRTPDTKDALNWRWTKGAPTTMAELGDPTTTTSYDLCIYDTTRGLVLTA